MIGRTLAALPCIALVTLLASSAHGDEAMSAAAKELHSEADEARQHERFDECLAKSRLAWQAMQHPKIAAARGDCAMEMGEYAEAATFLEYFLDRRDPATSAELVEALEAQLEKARAQVARVTLKANVEGAALLVDGEPPEQLTGALYVTPGSHTFTATKDGHRAEEQLLSLSGGEERTVTVTLTPIVGTPPQNGDPDGSSTPLAPVGWTGVGVGAAALIAGGILWGVTDGDSRDLIDRAAASRATTDCDAPLVDSQGLCPLYDEEFEDIHTRNQVGVGLMAAGAGLAAIGTILVIVDASAAPFDPPPDEGPRLDAWVGDGAGATLTVPF